MSKNIFDKADVILLGAGCANLSLAARANELIDYEFTIIDPGILCSNQGILNLTTLNDSLYNSLTWTGIGLVNSTGLLNPLLVSDSSLIQLFNDSICLSSDSLMLIVDIPDDPTIISNDTVYCENSFVQTPSVINSGGYWLGQGIDSLSGMISSNLIPGFCLLYTSPSPRDQRGSRLPWWG